MADVLVTVLISNYNYANFLDQAVQSALDQTYQNLEIIIVDDGSTDGSRSVIEGYQEKVKAVFKENGGQGSAFNLGFQHSSGDIVCILDADDIWLPDKVQAIVDAYLKVDNPAVLYHRVQNIDVSGNTNGAPWPPYPVLEGDVSKTVAMAGGWWPFPPSTGLSFSRRFLEKVMPMPEPEYRICADTYLADLAPFFGSVVGVEQPLSLFRIHDSNNWSNSAKIQERQAEYHKIRVDTTNQVLLEKGITSKLRLEDNLPYQRTRYYLSYPISLFRLSYLELVNPWNRRFLSKVKASFGWWLPSRG